MSVNYLECELSVWSGDPNECRLCSNTLPPARRKWCSGECLETWRENHRYFLARKIVIRKAKGKCRCVRRMGEERHVLCSRCKSCESVVKLRGGKMECDHIKPRNGDRTKFSCNHHPGGLQILCSFCHQEKTEEDLLNEKYNTV